MPVARYFLYVGGVLLALLFVADAYLPKQTVTASTVATAAPLQHSMLRIRSDRKWPERVVYDTNLPTIVPPTVQVAAAGPVPVAEVSAKARVRESFAQLAPADETKTEARPVSKRKIARARKSPRTPAVRVAQNPNFGFFGINTW